MARFRPRFVVCQTRSLGDTKLGPQISMAAHRRLGHTFEYLGHVESDETVAAATRRHRPVMAEFPEAKVCRNIEKIARRIISTEAERPPMSLPTPRLESEQTFYEVLETEPGVSDEEIRRAFRLCKEIYAVGSPVIAGLYEEAELVSLHERANAAHDTLFAPERRRAYDLSLPEADLARAVRRAAQAPHIDPVVVARPEGASAGNPSLDPDAEVSGAVLRKVRESRGMELSEVAQRTKISERHLRSIEDERFDELPAPVYVRGFVTQIARILHMDPARAADTYLRRFHGALGPGAGTPVLKEL
jgi:flagellar biosynthesis protein FlhG